MKLEDIFNAWIFLIAFLVSFWVAIYIVKEAVPLIEKPSDLFFLILVVSIPFAINFYSFYKFVTYIPKIAKKRDRK